MPEAEHRFDPDRPIRSHTVRDGERLIIHQDAEDPDHPLEKSAYIMGRPFPVRP